MLTHSIILAGESRGQRRLAGYSLWGHKESDTTEQLTLSLFTIRQQCLYLSIVTTYFHSFFLTLESNLTLLNQERQLLLRKSDCPHGKLLMPEKSSLKDQRLSFIYHHLYQLHPPKVAAYHGAEHNVQILMKNLEKRTNVYIVPLNTILDISQFMKVKVKSLSRVQLFVTPWTVPYQALLPMGFSRQEYWSELPFPSPGDLADPGIEPGSPALQAEALLYEPPEKSSFHETPTKMLGSRHY